MRCRPCSRQLQAPDATVRALTARILQQIGLDAKTAIPALTERLRDENPTVRDAAGLAVREIMQQSKAAGSLDKQLVLAPNSAAVCRRLFSSFPDSGKCNGAFLRLCLLGSPHF